MYTNQQRILYAKQLKRLHDLYVVKSNIHLTYKYKNQNKAIHNAQSLQDKIINAIIDDAVYGNGSKIKNIDATISELMTTTIENERKRIHRQDDRYVDRAVELNAENYSRILSNRINTEAIKLERKIESELASGIHDDLNEHQTRKALQEKYGNTAKARIKNIIRDSIHTNESNISWINALNEGYSYKVWMNGRGKGKVRNWHISKYISPVPIEDYFIIHGPKGRKESMYPGDLYSGAENVANCRCWLRYTNRRPERLGQKQTVFNIPDTSYMNSQNKPIDNVNNISGIRKPIETIKTSISNSTKKVTSKIKSIGGKLKGTFSREKVASKKYDFKKLSPQKKKNKKIINSENNKKTQHRTPEEIKHDLNNDYSFTKFIQTILEHNLATYNQLKESLTLISKSHKILKKLIEGTTEGVSIPKKFKGLLFHMTIHNHTEGAIIPSYRDMEKNFKHYVRYGVITSAIRIGVIRFNMKLSELDIDIILAKYSTFEYKIYAEFEKDKSKEISKCNSDEEELNLFYNFVSENNDKYVNEFNELLKDYNVEITYYDIEKKR